MCFTFSFSELLQSGVQPQPISVATDMLSLQQPAVQVGACGWEGFVLEAPAFSLNDSSAAGGGWAPSGDKLGGRGGSVAKFGKSYCIISHGFLIKGDQVINVLKLFQLKCVQ